MHEQRLRGVCLDGGGGRRGEGGGGQVPGAVEKRVLWTERIARRGSSDDVWWWHLMAGTLRAEFYVLLRSSTEVESRPTVKKVV